jgi:hypothetical protein
MRALLALAAAVMVAGGCMPVGRDFVRPTMTTFTAGVSSLDDVKKMLGEPTSQVAWSRSEGLFRSPSEDTPLPTPFRGAAVGGTARRLHYYYSFRVGEAARPGVEPSRSLSLWFWNDRLVAFTGSSSFKTDATSFDETKVGAIKPWASLRADVLTAFGEPTGVAVYPAAPLEDHEILIYREFEWDTSQKQYGAKSLFVVLNALGIVEDVRFSGSTRPIPPPAPTGTGAPIQIYTPPPRTRGR